MGKKDNLSIKHCQIKQTSWAIDKGGVIYVNKDKKTTLFVRTAYVKVTKKNAILFQRHFFYRGLKPNRS